MWFALFDLQLISLIANEHVPFTQFEGPVQNQPVFHSVTKLKLVKQIW